MTKLGFVSPKKCHTNPTSVTTYRFMLSGVHLRLRRESVCPQASDLSEAEEKDRIRSSKKTSQI